MPNSTAPSTIDIKTLHQKLEQNPNAQVIDVRSAAEYRSGHLPEAQHLALHELSQDSLEGITPQDEVFLICQSGVRSTQACEKLHNWGFENAITVAGGLNAWEKAGYPVKIDETAKATISIERQVRIGAGALVLLGALLGMLIHPAFLIIALFVGSGLIFAGLTNTCGMALLLARMPWNR